MFEIETQSIRKQFGDFVAVNDTSFKVEEGENFGLLGPNGAGKSTLIRMLTTLLLPTSGTAVVNGWDIRRDPNRVRQSIGVVPQALTSDPDLTAAENLDFCAKLHDVAAPARGEVVEELLAWVDLLEWRDKLVGTFSGGMRRRLEIARSLVHRPKILFLDEPTTGLDPASRLAMWEMLGGLKSQIALTIFLTTHYMEEADQLCDRVAIFDHGRVVALDTPDELKAQLPTARNINIQFGAAPEGWLDAVAALPGVERVDVADGSLVIASRDRTVTVASLLDAARSHHVTLSSLAFKENTLEDVFIHYTGRSTRDGADEKRRLDVRHFYERRRY